MIKNGAVDEVQNFEKLNLKSENNLYKVIGIREIKDFIDKKTSLKEMKLNIVIKTRQYAKRQKKWFNVNNYDISFDLHEISKNDIVDKLIQIN